MREAIFYTSETLLRDYLMISAINGDPKEHIKIEFDYENQNFKKVYDGLYRSNSGLLCVENACFSADVASDDSECYQFCEVCVGLKDTVLNQKDGYLYYRNSDRTLERLPYRVIKESSVAEEYVNDESGLITDENSIKRRRLKAKKIDQLDEFLKEFEIKE